MLKHHITLLGVMMVAVLQGCVSESPPPVGNAASDLAPSVSELPEGLTVEDGILRFRDKVVHPGAFRDLSTWISDTQPTVTAVDLEGCQNTERYGLNQPRIEKTIVCLYDNENQEMSPVQIPFFEYEYMGIVSDGIHVVRTADCGGGSGVFMSLLLVRFASERIYHWDKYRSRIIMACVGEFALGDRYYGKITVEKNGIRIGPHIGRSKTLSYPKERFVSLDQPVR